MSQAAEPATGAPRVIALPGHTPGSVAFHVPSVDALFIGDGMTPHWVLPGHGDSWIGGLPDALRLIRAQDEAHGHGEVDARVASRTG